MYLKKIHEADWIFCFVLTAFPINQNFCKRSHQFSSMTNVKAAFEKKKNRN